MTLSEREKEDLLVLIEHMTGNKFLENQAPSVFMNVQTRLRELGLSSVGAYFEKLETSTTELEWFISISTIHHTFWFRESEQLFLLRDWIHEGVRKGKKTFRIWSAACSTGQEVYTLAMILENFRVETMKNGRDFDYEIFGTDVDALSLRHAARAKYPDAQLRQIEPAHHGHLLFGTGARAGLFTLTPSIREKCKFLAWNLLEAVPFEFHFDVILLRNVLIYFPKPKQDRIVTNILSRLVDDGVFLIGASEAIDTKAATLSVRSHSTYQKLKPAQSILVVEDSPVMQARLRSIFEKKGFRAHIAGNIKEAEEILSRLPIDLITLDIHLPDQMSSSWLPAKRRQGMRQPVIIISNLHKAEAETNFELLVHHSEAYFEKSRLNGSVDELLETMDALLNKDGMLAEASALRSRPTERLSERRAHPSLLVVGASTGGPQALETVLMGLPAHCPPVVVVQHIPADFLKAFNERLAQRTGLKIGKLTDGSPLLPGHLYGATHDEHIAVERDGTGWRMRFNHSPHRNRHRPSVDILFESIRSHHNEVIAVLLTGMGKDGAAGMKRLHDHGAYTMAQNFESCIVFGMPGEAVRLGAVDFLGDPKQIRQSLLTAVKSTAKPAA